MTIQKPSKQMSLESRFLLTLITLLLTVLLMISIVLALSGVLNINHSQTAALFQHELTNIADRISEDYSTISSHAVSLSKELSREIEYSLEKKDIAPEALPLHPEIINEVLESLYPILAGECKAVQTSGIYAILNATINPALEKADYSRACIYLKNISVQNNGHSSYQDIRYLYGPQEIGRNHSLTLLPQWQLEYDISTSDFYQITMNTARSHNYDSLPQLMYWCPLSSDGGSDQAMFCTVPLVASDGTIMGVCGFDISTMQFKLHYPPKIKNQNYIFCMMSPSDDKQIYFERSLFAGNYAVAKERPNCNIAHNKSHSLELYSCKQAGDFYGLETSVSLYPKSSYHSKNGYTLSLLAPSSQLHNLNRSTNLRYIGILFGLLALGILLSILLCKRNIRPMRDAIVSIRRNGLTGTPTNIKEIDDLFDFLAEKDRAYEESLKQLQVEKEIAIHQTAKARATAERLSKENIVPSQEDITRFTRNLGCLTQKEREIFDLYLQGYKAKEISDLLGISTNTIKYHNKNIYSKLDVSSRTELLSFAKTLV